MEFAVAAIVLIYSLFRGWQNAIFPFVLIVFLNAFEWWLRLREPFFFAHKDLLDIFFVLLVGLSLAHHALPDLKQHLRLNNVEIALALVIAYSCLSFTWSTGAEIIQLREPNFVKNALLNYVIYLFMLPMLFRASLDKHGFERDLTLVGLSVLPLITLTTDWQNRGATYLFTVHDPETDEVAASLNPLNLAFFASVMICFAVCYMRKSFRSILTLGVVMALAFYLLIETQSRGQLFSTILCLPLIVLFLRPTFRTRYLLVVGPLLLLPFTAVALNIGTIAISFLEVTGFSQSYLTRLTAATMEQDWAVRMNQVRAVAEAWSTSPGAILFGLGTASSFAHAGAYIHNVTLEVLFEQGIIIFMLFAFVVVRTLAAIAIMLDINGLTNDDRRLAVFFSALYVILLIVSMKQGSLYKTPNLIMIMLFCTILAEHLKRKYPLRDAAILSPLGQESRVEMSISLR